MPHSALRLGFAVAAAVLLGTVSESHATSYTYQLGDTSTQDGRQGGAYLYYDLVGGDKININYSFQDVQMTYNSLNNTLNIGGWAYGTYCESTSTIETATTELIQSMEGWVEMDMTYRDNVTPEYDQFGNLVAVNVGPQSANNKGTFSYYDNNLVSYLFDEIMPNMGLSLNVTTGGLGQGYFYGSAALVDNHGAPYSLFAQHVSGEWYFCSSGECGDHATPIPEPATMALLTSGLLAGAYRRRRGLAQ